LCLTGKRAKRGKEAKPTKGNKTEEYEKLFTEEEILKKVFP
jgi:hypothetical protein